MSSPDPVVIVLASRLALHASSIARYALLILVGGKFGSSHRLNHGCHPAAGSAGTPSSAATGHVNVSRRPGDSSSADSCRAQSRHGVRRSWTRGELETQRIGHRLAGLGLGRKFARRILRATGRYTPYFYHATKSRPAGPWPFTLSDPARPGGCDGPARQCSHGRLSRKTSKVAKAQGLAFPEVEVRCWRFAT